jgi:hypothetical protein
MQIPNESPMSYRMPHEIERPAAMQLYKTKGINRNAGDDGL